MISDLLSAKYALYKTPIKFILISGMGWFFDFIVYVLLISFEFPSFLANLFSSYVGLTFVYFTSLNKVFEKKFNQNKFFLLVYWGFHFFSILIYSKFLSIGCNEFGSNSTGLSLNAISIMGKILITPINLTTNFIFMKYLARSMQ